MMSIGLSSYHRLLADAVRDRAEDYLNTWQAEADSPESNSWESQVERRMVVTLLTATYLESLANLMLSLNLDTTQFAEAEGKPLLVKWAKVPRHFIPGYSFPKNGPLREDLNTLVARRNAIVHMKPQVFRERTKVHEGNAFLVSSDDHRLLLRWLSLPIRLIEYFETQAGVGSVLRFRSLSGVDALRGLAQAKR